MTQFFSLSMFWLFMACSNEADLTNSSTTGTTSTTTTTSQTTMTSQTTTVSTGVTTTTGTTTTGLTDHRNSIGANMMAISAGSFDMGCTPGQSSCNDDESPVHTVTITRNFYMMQTEVTQDQWMAVMGTNPATSSDTDFDGISDCGGNCPVETVAFEDVIAFANTLSEREGFSAAYVDDGSGYTQNLDSDGYRLPTEAEWEYAARCGQDTLYAGSDNHNLVGWVNESAPQEVAQMAPNDCGLFDMTGNVAEWVWDAYDPEYYSVSISTDPVGPVLDSPRTVRGGSAYDFPSKTRVSARALYIVANWGIYYVGVRFVRTVQ